MTKRNDESNSRLDHSEDIPLILLVEDEADYRMLVASDLEEDYQVVEAANGKEGLAKALETIPDLVVTDLMMPVMDGIELCRRLKTGVETAHIPVVMLTAKTAVESQVEGLQTGADDYVTKPFHMTLLELRIRNLLERQTLLRKKFQQDFLNLNRPEAEHSAERGFLDRAYQVVEAQCGDPTFRPEDFAEALNMGMRSLQRKLKSAADSTPMKFITEVRMAEAAKLLAGSDQTITEIAFEVGCDDSSNFSKLFKQHFDMPPSQYRSTYR